MQSHRADMLQEEACGSEDPGAGAAEQLHTGLRDGGAEPLQSGSENGKQNRQKHTGHEGHSFPAGKKTARPFLCSGKPLQSTGVAGLKNKNRKGKTMNRKNENLRNMIFTAMCIALCPVVPIFAGLFPNGRQLFSPMHIPALLCGLVTGPWYGLAAGVLGPLFSFAVTGMPPAGKLPQMILELGCYGLFTGLGMKFIRSGKLRTDLWLSLLIAMIIGRIAGGLANALIFMRGAYSMKMWTTAYFAGTAPGIVIHLLVIPAVYFALEQAGLIPRRYPR